jgi:hypothetical protein
MSVTEMTLGERSSPNGRAVEPSGSEMVGRIGPVEVDWPRSLGFFGGVALAVGVGLIEPPLGLFIAAVPFLKMLKADALPAPGQFVGRIFEGMAKPVGGDGEGTIRLASPDTGESDAPLD